MIPLSHHAAAAPMGVGMAWAAVTVAELPLGVALGCAGLVVWSSTLNDLDHPMWKHRPRPLAALVRGSARLGYMIRTGKDQVRADVHRGPSHCVEWCVLCGVLVAGLTSLIAPLAPWAWWWGAAVFVGTASHVLLDWPTLSGVPLSAVYNYLRHGEVWRRHSLRWFATDSGEDRFLVAPALFLLTGLMGLGMLGWLRPAVTWLTGGVW